MGPIVPFMMLGGIAALWTVSMLMLWSWQRMIKAGEKVALGFKTATTHAFLLAIVLLSLVMIVLASTL